MLYCDMNMKSLMVIATSLVLFGCQATAPTQSDAKQPAATPKAASLESTAPAAPAAAAAAAAPVNMGSLLAAVTTLPARPVDPAQRRCANLQFTPTANEPKIEYRLELSMQVGLDGHVTQARVSRPSGHAQLDQAALLMAQSCRFNPVQGAYQPAQIIQPLHYRVK